METEPIIEIEEKKLSYMNFATSYDKKLKEILNNDNIEILIKAKELTKQLFSTLVTDEGHTFNHIIDVYNYGIDALLSDKYNHMTQDYIVAILLSCIGHEWFDNKIFRDGKFNGPEILKHIGIRSQTYDLTLEMIHLVSASTNGNRQVTEKWKLIPRDCDRICALGKGTNKSKGGIFRAFAFTFSDIGSNQLISKNTPLPVNLKELKEVMKEYSLEKYVEMRKYKKRSDSMLDHFYDKLLLIGEMSSENTYLQNVANIKMREMQEFLFKMNKLIKEYILEINY